MSAIVGRDVVSAVSEQFATSRGAVGSRAHSRPCWRRILEAWSSETTVARNVVQRVDGVPCARSTRMAYSRLELDDSNVVTWSAAVSLSLTITPRIRRLDTRSMSGRGGSGGGGGGGGGTFFGLALKTISFVLSRFSFKLLSTVHRPRPTIAD